MRRLMEAAEPVFRQSGDDYWAAAQDADLLIYPISAALQANAIPEKLRIPAFAAYLQHVHPTSA